MQTPDRPLQAGAPAPDIVLPGVNREGNISLRDFRGRRAVLIGLFRGLHCPFCRRQVVQLGAAQPELDALDVEVIAVINTPVERARLYYRHRPLPIVLLADPEASSHRAFGVPAGRFVSEDDPAPQWPLRATRKEFDSARVDPTGEIGELVHPMRGNEILNQKDGFQLSATDEQILAAHAMQLTGHFLIDRAGIVRWAQTEAPERATDLCRFPSTADIIAAARTLPR